MSTDPRTVAALFVDRAGPYAKLPGIDLWDETRDARLYPGPHPVVAHPPCARWCKMAKRIEKKHGYRVGDDGGVFAAAIAAVRRWGGVLEHPAWSLAWTRFGLAPPARWGWSKSITGEWVCEVAQSAYGHDALKPTWLVLCGADPPEGTDWRRPRGKRSMTYFSQRHPGDFNTSRSHAERMTSSEIHLTPLPFAEFLVGLARRVPPRGD